MECGGPGSKPGTCEQARGSQAHMLRGQGLSWWEVRAEGGAQGSWSRASEWRGSEKGPSCHQGPELLRPVDCDKESGSQMGEARGFGCFRRAPAPRG